MSRDLAAMGSRPLAISVLLGVSGWFAGLFVLMFVGLAFRPDNGATAALCGAVLLVSAWGLFLADGDGEQVFVAQLALALSIAGQCLVLYAVARPVHGPAPVAAAALLLQVLLALAMPNRLHRTLSTLFATVAWALWLHFALFDDVWSHGAIEHASPSVTLASWLLAWLPVGAGLGWAIRHERALDGRVGEALVQPLLAGLTAGLAFATLASMPFDAIRGTDGGGAVALWPLLSALAALGALAAAFARRRRGLMALCLVATLLHVAHFYYALGFGLRDKALLMGAMGAVFLAAAHVLRTKERT